MPMYLYLGDITRMETDAIVNAAGTDLRRCPGICDAIFAAADTDTAAHRSLEQEGTVVLLCQRQQLCAVPVIEKNVKVFCCDLLIKSK